MKFFGLEARHVQRHWIQYILRSKSVNAQKHAIIFWCIIILLYLYMVKIAYCERARNSGQSGGNLIVSVLPKFSENTNCEFKVLIIPVYSSVKSTITATTGHVNKEFLVLHFIPINVLNHHYSYHPKPDGLLCIKSEMLFHVSTRSFLCPLKNSVKHWTSHTKNYFLRKLEPCSNFFTENRVVEPF